MIVSDVRVNSRADTKELSALVDGFRFCFRFPASIDIVPRGDLFLAATFVAAMGACEPLEITPDAPVSPRLLEGVDRYKQAMASQIPYQKPTAVVAATDPTSVPSLEKIAPLVGSKIGIEPSVAQAQEALESSVKGN